MAAVPSLTFGALLRRYRLAAGLTQEELASEAGLSLRGIADLGRGARTQPRKATVQLLADAPRPPPLSSRPLPVGGLGSRACCCGRHSRRFPPAAFFAFHSRCTTGRAHPRT